MRMPSSDIARKALAVAILTQESVQKDFAYLDEVKLKAEAAATAGIVQPLPDAEDIQNYIGAMKKRMAMAETMINSLARL